MGNEAGVAGVGQAAVQGVEQPEAPVGLAEQQGTGVGGQGAAGEVGLEPAAVEGSEGKGSGGTLCHSGGPLAGVVGSC